MDEKCAACLEFLDDFNILLLPCGHNTCRSCFLHWNESSVNVLRCMTCRFIIDRPFRIQKKIVIPFKMLPSPRLIKMIIHFVNALPVIIEYLKIMLIIMLDGYLIYTFLRVASICFVPAYAVSNITSSDSTPYCVAPIVIYDVEISYSSFVLREEHQRKNIDELSFFDRDIFELPLSKYCFLSLLFGFIFVTSIFTIVWIEKICRRFKLHRITKKNIQNFAQKKFSLYYQI